MWFPAMLILSVMTSASMAAGREDLPILSSPTNVTVGRASDTTAFVSWNFAKPPKLSLRRVEFVLLLEASKQPELAFYSRFMSPPLNTTLTGLTPDTEYSMRIQATSPNWRDSAVAGKVFVTLEKDWSAPSIIRFSQTRLDGGVEYFVKWSIDVLPPQLTHFEVEVCRRSCSILRRNRSDSSVDLYFVHDSSFALRVIACYDLPFVGRIRRYSGRVSGYTGKGSPERILKAENVAQVGNNIKLAWHPPLGTGGAISYYDLLVSNPAMRAKPEILVDYSTASLLSKVLTGGPYELRFAPERDAGAQAPFVSETNVGLHKCFPRKPLLLMVDRKTRKAARFRIIFRDCGASSRVNYEQRADKHLLLGAAVLDAFGFAPYTSVFFGIRSCLGYEGKSLKCCGNFTALESFSSTAPPSPVQDVSWYFKETDKVVIAWEKPKHARGPIDGYRILVYKTYLGMVESQDLTLGPNTRSFIIENFENQKTYYVSIAAFNFHSKVKSMKLLGDWADVLPSQKLLPRWTGILSGFFGALFCCQLFQGPR